MIYEFFTAIVRGYNFPLLDKVLSTDSYSEQGVILLNIYSAEVPLRYGSIPHSGETQNYQRNSMYVLDQPIVYHYRISMDSDTAGIKQEDCKDGTVEICAKKKDFSVKLSRLLAADENEAISQVRGILKDICRNLSFLAQQHQEDTQFFYLGVYWRDRDIKLCLEESNVDIVVKKENKDGTTTLYFRDDIRPSDSLSMTCTYTLTAEDFSHLHQIGNSDSSFRFMLRAFYGALMDSDISSKYFRLFTIIEYLEQNFISKEPWDKLIPQKVSENILEDFISSIKQELQESGEEEKSVGDRAAKIKPRLSSIVKTATMESRAEKLFCYLSKHYEIKTVKSAVVSYPFTLKEVNDLINQRNRLFHGNEKDEEKKHLKDITGYLLLLCRNIMEKEMELYSREEKAAGQS